MKRHLVYCSVAKPELLPDSALHYLEYLASIVAELGDMANRQRLPFIAGLLAMTRLEAERTLHRSAHRAPPQT